LFCIGKGQGRSRKKTTKTDYGKKGFGACVRKTIYERGGGREKEWCLARKEAKSQLRLKSGGTSGGTVRGTAGKTRRNCEKIRRLESKDRTRKKGGGKASVFKK